MAGAYLGDFPTSATVYVYFDTFASTGASVTITGLAVTDIEIYKDGSTTQRASDAGYTLLDTDGIDFDGLTGIHGFSIDTSDNTDAGFYAAGHEYTVVVSAVTCDSQTISFVAAHFSIERAGGALALLKNATYGLSALETLVDDLESRLGTPSDLGSGATVAANLVDIEGQTDDIGTAGAGLTAVPWNAAWDAEVESEANDALVVLKLDHLVAVADGDDPVDNSIIAKLASKDATADWSDYDNTTDSLEANRDNIGTAGANLTIAAVTGAVGSVTAGVNLADDAITSAKFDESTAFPLASADTGATAVARTGADSDTLETLSDQIDAIGSGTGAALNFAVSEDNTSSPIKSVSSVGSQTGTYNNTLADDGAVHQIDSTEAPPGTHKIDWIYGFSCGAGRAASKFVSRARMSATGDTVTVQAYNFGTSSWDTRTTISGTAETLRDVPLLSGHTGTGADEGKVYIRFVFSDTDAGTLIVDEAYVQAQQSGSLIGYADGAIWVADGGVATTVPYVDGTADNPCTWTAAQTIATLTGLTRFRIQNGSTVTLAAACESKSLIGNNWTLALGGQSITGSYFYGAKQVTGTSSGTFARFEECVLGSGAAGATLPPGLYDKCSFNTPSGQAFVGSAAGTFVFTDCISYVATGGATTPYFTITGASPVMFRRYSGGANITLDDSGAAVTYEVIGGGNITCALAGADIEIRGMPRDITLTGIASTSTVRFVGATGPISLAGADGAAYFYGHVGVITDNRTGSPSTTNTAASLVNINAEADTALSDIKLDHLVAVADSDDPVDNSIIAKLASKAATANWSDYNNTTDSLEAQRDNVGTASNLGGGATIAANLSDIEGQTDDIGTAGAGLTAVPWNSSWDAEVESEANDALVVLKLDHLVAVADGDDPVNNSIIAKLASKDATADWSDYDNTTDSLEANRDNIGTAGATLTSVALAATGLDAVSTTAPTGVASNFREMVVQTWRRFFKKVDMTSTQMKTYADNGTSVLTTQTVSDDSTTQTQGAAT